MVPKFLFMVSFSFSALTLLVGQQEGHPTYKNWVVGCWTREQEPAI